MKNNETAVVATTETPGTSAVAKNAIRPLTLQAPAEDFEQSDLKSMAAIFAELKGKDLAKAKISSVNMVLEYLKFDDLQGEPVRRFFMGWTARPLLDFNTKQPIIDDDGQQMYGPAVILYDPKTESMQVNQAFDIVKFAHESRIPQGTAIQMTFTRLRKTSTGRNKQSFDIRTLDADEV